MKRVLVIRPLFGLFVRLEVEGLSHLPRDREPLLIVSNHTSLLDTPAVLFAMPPPWRRRIAPAMAIETLPERFAPEGNPLLARLRSRFLYGLAVALFNAYPMPATRGFRPSLEYTGELMDAGLSPLVFPEGEMTRTGEMRSFKEGIGLLAAETRATILPVRLEGLAGILPPGSHWPARGPLPLRGRGRARVVIGRPVAAADLAGLDHPRIASRLTEAVRSAAGAVHGDRNEVGFAGGS